MKPWEDGALIYLQDKRKLACVSTGYFGNRYQRPGDSLVAQTIKYLPVMQETWVRSLSWKDTLEEGMAGKPLLPVFLPGESPCTEESGGLQSMGSQKVRHD